MKNWREYEAGLRRRGDLIPHYGCRPEPGIAWGRNEHPHRLRAMHQRREASDVAPSSQYWLTNNPDNTPLRTWAEAQEKDQATELGEVIHI